MKNPNNRPRQIGFYILILTILLATVYTMLVPTNEGGELEYSEIITLFREEKVESFALNTDGSLHLELREEYKERETYDVTVVDFSVFYSDLDEVIQKQLEDGTLTEYDYEKAWTDPCG